MRLLAGSPVATYAEGVWLNFETPLATAENVSRGEPWTTPPGPWQPVQYVAKSGWMSAKFGPKDEVPLEMLLAWLDESFRAVAPKR